MANTISMKDVENILNDTIDNNIRLEEIGETPIAIGIEAGAGIGKTSIIRDVAKSRGMQFVKLNLAMMDEAGDLIGFPQIEYECQIGKVEKDDTGKTFIKAMNKTVWLNGKQMDNPPAGIKYRQTGKTRMGYAKPAWVPEYNENGTLVLLDDFVRANPSILQAAMDLILEQKYVSWQFPAKTTIALTNNPENGEYNVNSMDPAYQTRFIGYEVEWDMDLWCKWAEGKNMDGRCINFVYDNADLLFKVNEHGNSICTPRSYTMFANMISGIKDWDSKEGRSKIMIYAKGCFKDGSGKFAEMFGAFLSSKAYRLIAPDKILNGDWETEVKPKMEDALYDNGKFNPMISTILGKRFAHYVCNWLNSDKKTPIKTVADKLAAFMNMNDSGHTYFNTETMYYMLKTITAENKQQTNKLLMDQRIMKILNNGN